MTKKCFYLEEMGKFATRSLNLNNLVDAQQKKNIDDGTD